MKTTFEFDLDNPDHARRMKNMMKAEDAHLALYEIRQQIFRPARKHLYSDKELNELIEQCPKDSEGYNIGLEIISLLEQKFNDILEECGVNEEGEY